jgi:type IV pilus assembly protein PilV
MLGKIAMHRPAKTSGFTLLEVLIALLVFSLGLMGLAGLLVVSVQTNHSAYLRTQASFLAQTMADRMRANILGVWNGSYAGAYAAGSAATSATCLGPTYCSFGEIATRDRQIWINQLASFLPNPNATIACATAVAVPPADSLAKLPPYSGLCTITMIWNEASTDRAAAANPETLAWVFEP